MTLHKRRWLVPALIVAVLLLLGLSAQWWFPLLFGFIDTNSNVIQSLADLVQLILWLGAAVFAVLTWWQGRGKAPDPPAAAAQPRDSYQAKIDHSGAVAQGRGATAADREGQAVSNTTVEGDLLGPNSAKAVATAPGSTAIGIVQGNVYIGRPAQDPGEALAIYRRVLLATARQLPLRGVDVGASDPTGEQPRFDLAQIYVELDTTGQVPVDKEEKKRTRARSAPPGERETRPLRALEAAAANRRLVLLGDPGSGKSTFLSHLGLCLAGHGLEAQAGWMDRLPEWPQQEADLVPVLVILRDFAGRLPAATRKAEPQHLWDFIVERLKAQNLGFAADPLHAALEEGRAIVLLDGLDEIPNKVQRTLIRDAVAVFAGRYAKSRVIVTCRTLSYQDPAWQVGGFPSFELAPLDEEKIGKFIRAWYAELGRLGVVKTEEAGQLAQRLQEAIRRVDLWRLAPNPLLLTVMALVHTHKGRLPDARALLYEETVDILLWRWEQIKSAADKETPRLRQLLLDAGRTDVDLKRVLWRLAFGAHGQGGAGGGETLADIAEWTLVKALAELHPEKSTDWAQQVAEAMKLRAGLLLERAPEIYTFPHRTFQEYLAGAHLSTEANFARQAARLVAEGPFWREVILLAVGRLVYLSGDTDRPLALVGELCPEKTTNDEVAWRKAWLAGDALVEMGLNRVQDSALGRDLAGRVRLRLVELLRGGRLQPVERAAAGDTLARLGDPRFRAEAWQLPDEPLLGFVEIPAGPFVMGSDKKHDRQAEDRELPQHEVTLPGYYMVRYPVTVAQFRAFVEDKGYKLSYPDSLRDLPTRPVRYVTWYDAMAYCEWLTERLREWEKTPEPLAALLRGRGADGRRWRVTLPSEAEWEKAARGGLQIPAPPAVSGVGAGLAPALAPALALQPNPHPRRIYPWGDEIDVQRANYDDTGIGTTSAVGCFAGGASPYGIEDMSGNVWEWTRSLWGNDWQKPDYRYPYDAGDERENLKASRDVLRVLRGGWFSNNERIVRCAYRYGAYPHYRYDLPGFRVVVSPL